jgi:hypothetical protein
MPNFLYQVESTDPACWIKIQAESLRTAAITVAAKFGPGNKNVRVNVAFDGEDNLYPNGAPKVSHNFVLDVEKK